MHCWLRHGLVTIMWAIVGVYSASAQQNAAAGQNQASTPDNSSSDIESQQERAENAMRESLERQQSAVQQIRDGVAVDSLHKQQVAVSRQLSQWQESSNTPSATTHASTQKDELPAASTDSQFFALPWPDAAPLTVPNVQVVDESCQALPQTQVDQLISEASKKWRVDTGLLRSVMRQESGFKACALSTSGAMGLMQIMPDTADFLGLQDPYDPAKNVDAGAKYLKMMLDRYQGNLSMALAAYNAGPGRVDKSGGIPQISETIQYITNILKSLPGLY